MLKMKLQLFAKTDPKPEPTPEPTPTPTPVPTPPKDKEEIPSWATAITTGLKDLGERLTNLEKSAPAEPTVTVPIPPAPKPKEETPAEVIQRKSFLDLLW